MDRLSICFGRPQIVVPLLIEKMEKPQTFTSDYEGLSRLLQQVLDGYDAVLPHTKDSLATYLVYRTPMSFSPKLKEDWENNIAKSGSSPTLEALRKYATDRLLQMTPSVSSVLNTSTSTHASSKPAKYKPSKCLVCEEKYKPSKCLVCEEKHALLHCPTFISYDVDRRNNLVRDRKLCINCFSDNHGVKNCLSRYTCRSCGAKHHTLLHREKQEEAHTSSYNLVHEVTPQSKVPIERGLGFLPTIKVKLFANGRTAQARAVLDSGSAVTVMTESLASSLKLSRIPSPLASLVLRGADVM